MALALASIPLILCLVRVDDITDTEKYVNHTIFERTLHYHLLFSRYYGSIGIGNG